MKKTEKRNLLILICVAVVIIVGLIIIKNNNKNSTNNQMADNKEVVNYKELESGNKLNVSSKLMEKKYFGNYEVTNIQLIEKDGKTELRADIKNIGDKKLDFTNAVVTFLDKDGKEIAKVNDVLIGEVEAGKTTKLNVKSSVNSINAYDFSISISK